MQQTHLELAAAIANKSGRRELRAEGHQNRASAGANTNSEEARWLAAKAFQDPGYRGEVFDKGSGGRGATAAAPITFLRLAAALRLGSGSGGPIPAHSGGPRKRCATLVRGI
jgi:hypothetical protein